MDFRRALVLGSFVGSILVACSSHNTFFFGDGGLEGGTEQPPDSDSGVKADAKRRDTATGDETPVDLPDTGKDTGKDTATKDVSTCTLAQQVSSDPTCNGCAESSCCTEANACFVVADCLALDSCYLNCINGDANGASTCQTNCDNLHSGSVSKWNAASQCLQTSCATECGL